MSEELVTPRVYAQPAVLGDDAALFTRRPGRRLEGAWRRGHTPGTSRRGFVEPGQVPAAP